MQMEKKTRPLYILMPPPHPLFVVSNREPPKRPLWWDTERVQNVAVRLCYVYVFQCDGQPGRQPILQRRTFFDRLGVAEVK